MIRPVILSGGGGTRLWPLSRSGNPKQFQRLLGDESLLQATAQRCRGPEFHAPLISTGEEQRFFVTDQLEGVDVAADAILLEPMPRNTAPAIAAAAFWALDRGEDDPMLVMPSDHVIEDLAALGEAVQAALPSALEGKLLTFGIRPTAAKTGYGYLQARPGGGAGPRRRTLRRETRRPERPKFVADGSYFWNSGLFLFRPSAYLRELKLYAPDVAAEVGRAMDGAQVDGLSFGRTATRSRLAQRFGRLCGDGAFERSAGGPRQLCLVGCRQLGRGARTAARRRAGQCRERRRAHARRSQFADPERIRHDGRRGRARRDPVHRDQGRGVRCAARPGPGSPAGGRGSARQRATPAPINRRGSTVRGAATRRWTTATVSRPSA